MSKPPPPKKFSTDEARRRVARGQEAAVYTELIDIDEVEGLNDAYLAIQDGEFPPKQPPAPLTSDEFKHYVRLVYNAIRSIDAARDAYAKDKDGKVTGKTFAKEYLDSIDMFETQLVAAKLVKAVHRVQAGTISSPAWTEIPGVGYSRYDTFAERMAHVIEALRVWKMFGCALFMDHEAIMEKRLAMQPEKEMLTERFFREDTEHSDISPLLRLQYARSILPDPDPESEPEPDEPVAATKNDEGDKRVDKHADKAADKAADKGVDKHEDADTSDTPAPASKKRKHSNSDAALNTPGERPYNTRSAKKQSVAPAAAALANTSTSAKAGPSTAVSSDVASGSVQPTTPAAPPASNTARLTRSASAARASSARSSRSRSVQPAGASFASPSAGITSGRRSARRRATQQQASSDPQPSNDRCDAKFLPSQPSHMQDSPPPDYLASQRALYGSQPVAPLGEGHPPGLDYFEALAAQYAPAFRSYHHQPSQYREVTAINNPLTYTTFTNLLNDGSSVIHGGVGGFVVNNYFQPRTPSPPGGSAPADPNHGKDQTLDYYFGPDKSQTHKDNQAVSERDSALPPRAPPITPQDAATTDRNVQEPYQVDESLLPFGRLPGNYPEQHQVGESLLPFGRLPELHPSNYDLPPNIAALAATTRGLPVVYPVVSAPPRSGWSLNLAGEDPTDAMAIQDCRRVGYGLSPVHTTSWSQQEGQPATARDTPAAGPSVPAPRAGSSLDMEEHTLEEKKALADWHRTSMGLYPVHTTGWRFQEEEPDTPYAWTGPPEGTDDFVPFREASEEYEYDFKEEARNQAKNKAGDKRKRDEGPEDGARAVGSTAAARTQTKPYTAKITQVVSTRPNYQVRTLDEESAEAIHEGNRMTGLQAVRSAANARIPATRFRITDDMFRRSHNQANIGAGDKVELVEDREDGSRTVRLTPAPRARTPTKRYRINPRLGR